jgi:hypothetical protein
MTVGLNLTYVDFASEVISRLLEASGVGSKGLFDDRIRQPVDRRGRRDGAITGGAQDCQSTDAATLFSSLQKCKTASSTCRKVGEVDRRHQDEAGADVPSECLRLSMPVGSSVELD